MNNIPSQTQIEVVQCESVGKGKFRVSFDTGLSCLLYKGELKQLGIRANELISDVEYERMLSEVLTKRATKRAMHLLEKMDRTEKQLRDKLKVSEYPECCIDAAIEYVTRYHYLDDARYAENYVRYSQEKKSKMRIKQDLMAKGISRDLIDLAIEEEYQSEESSQIEELLRKRHFVQEEADQKEFQRTYQFLLRRGFSSSEILKAMKYKSDNY